MKKDSFINMVDLAHKLAGFTCKHKVSDCCGASPKNDMQEEMGLCSECGCHCTYEADTEES